MFYKPLAEIELGDLELLVSNRVKENTQLDYKLSLPDTNDAGKKELLKDISAFANTSGGYLIYGIKEEEVGGKKTGVAGKITGIQGINSNELQLSIESSVRSNIEPRLVGLEFKEIKINETHSVFIIRIPRSWNMPHVVSFGNHWRFYGRNSAGNYPMDITQLKNNFELGNTIPEKLEERRNTRLSLIRQKYRMSKGENSLPIIVIHIQPFDSLNPTKIVDLNRAIRENDNLSLRLGGQFYPAHNFDGLRVKESGNYLQIFHSGMTEQVIRTFPYEKGEGKIVRAYLLERLAIQGTGWRLGLLKTLGVESPLVVQVSLLGIGEYKLEARVLSMHQTYDRVINTSSDRDDLIVRPLFIDSLSSLEIEGFYIDGRDQFPNSWKAAENCCN